MRAGWGAGRPAADAAGRVDLLACPANASCLGFNLLAPVPPPPPAATAPIDSIIPNGAVWTKRLISGMD